MPAHVLCIARRLPLTEEHVVELQRIAGDDVVIVEANAGDRSRIVETLSQPWTAIWARGLPADLAGLVDQHAAVKLVAIRVAFRQGRKARPGGINDRFDRLEARNSESSRPIENLELALVSTH